MSDALLTNLQAFVTLLRRAGLNVHAGRLPECLEAIGHVGVTSRRDVRAALRTLLVHRADDVPRFDEAFDVFWRRHAEPGGELRLFSLGERARTRIRASGGQVAAEIDAAGHEPSGAGEQARLAAGAYSAADVSRTKDFAEFTPEDLRRAQAALDRLAWSIGERRTRRWRSSTRGRLDLRRMARRSLRYGGELLDLPRRRRQDKPRPLLVLCDVSGSMERYSRMLLRLVYALGHGRGRVESFLFATRLTRVTRQASGRDPSRALSRLTRSVQDWGGGTRIGEALRTLNVHWSRRVTRNAPIVLIVSDGWDRGDVELLAREMQRLRRRAHRVIWLNPLLGSASYEPLTRGMQAALRYVDDFLPANNLRSLEGVVAVLGTV